MQPSFLSCTKTRVLIVLRRDAHAILLCFLLAMPVMTVVAQSGSRVAEIRDHAQRGENALKANDPETAVREFHSVLSLDPRNAEANTNLGVIEFFREDYPNASQYFRAALAAQPALTKAQAFLALCKKRMGDPSARLLLEKSFPKVKEKGLRTEVGVELADIYYQSGELDHAAPVMGSLVDINPDNIDVLFMAQRLYSELADETLNKLAVLGPASARMQQAIAEHLINEGDLRHATEHYQKALEIDPHLPGIRYEVAETILESGGSGPSAEAEAEKELGMVIANEGDSAKVEGELGKIALLRSDSEGARTHYNRAFALNPKDTDAQLGMGRVLMTMEKPQNARKYLEMAVQADPLNGEARYRLALDYRHLGMADEAEKEMRLFQEIKKTRDQVRELYRQMNKQSKSDDLDTLGNEK